jgi:hypothetical protein
MSFVSEHRLNGDSASHPQEVEMSAVPSQLTLAHTGVVVRRKSAQTRRIQPWMLLRDIGEQVRALLLAKRPPTGQFGNSAWAAEDDYSRFSNRSF